MSWTQFKHQNGWLAVWLIADTGADKTLLPRYLSQQLNISLEKDCFRDKDLEIWVK